MEQILIRSDHIETALLLRRETDMLTGGDRYVISQGDTVVGWYDLRAGVLYDAPDMDVAAALVGAGMTREDLALRAWVQD